MFDQLYTTVFESEPSAPSSSAGSTFEQSAPELTDSRCSMSEPTDASIEIGSAVEDGFGRASRHVADAAHRTLFERAMAATGDDLPIAKFGDKCLADSAAIDACQAGDGGDIVVGPAADAQCNNLLEFTGADRSSSAPVAPPERRSGWTEQPTLFGAVLASTA